LCAFVAVIILASNLYSTRGGWQGWGGGVDMFIQQQQQQQQQQKQAGMLGMRNKARREKREEEGGEESKEGEGKSNIRKHDRQQQDDDDDDDGDDECASCFVEQVTSHFSDKVHVQELVTTSNSWDSTPIVYPTTGVPEVCVREVTLAARASTSWHIHLVPHMVFVLKGCILVELRDKRNKTFTAGSAFVDSQNLSHRMSNPSNEEAELLFFLISSSTNSVSYGFDFDDASLVT